MRKLRGKGNEKAKDSSHKTSFEFANGYIYSDIESRLIAFAESSGGLVSFEDLATGLVATLQAAIEAGREQLGNSDYLRRVWGAPRQGSPTMESLALAPFSSTDGPQGPVGGKKKRRLSQKAIASIRRAQKLRWAKYKADKAKRSKAKMSGIQRYWAGMTKAERSAEIRRRMVLSGHIKAA